MGFGLRGTGPNAQWPQWVLDQVGLDEMGMAELAIPHGAEFHKHLKCNSALTWQLGLKKVKRAVDRGELIIAVMRSLKPLKQEYIFVPAHTDSGKLDNQFGSFIANKMSKIYEAI